MKEEAKGTRRERWKAVWPWDEQLVCMDMLTAAAICWLGKRNNNLKNHPDKKPPDPNSNFGMLFLACWSKPVCSRRPGTQAVRRSTQRKWQSCRAAELSQPQPRLEKHQCWVDPSVPSASAAVAHGMLERSKLKHTGQEKPAAQLDFPFWKIFQATLRWKMALWKGVGEIPQTNLIKVPRTNPVYM